MRELLSGGIDRRRFLQLMSASLGLAGLAGCRRPEIKALPYSRQPEEIVPGLPDFYATAIPRRGSGFPVLVESHEGRPTKIEGNPRHPDSGGSSDAIAQASVLDLYDPDRSSPVLQKGQPSTWQDTTSSPPSTTPRSASGRERAANPQRRRGLAVSGSACENTARRSCPRPDGTSIEPISQRQRAGRRLAGLWYRRSCRATSSIRPRSSSRWTATSSASRKTAPGIIEASPAAGWAKERPPR